VVVEASDGPKRSTWLAEDVHLAVLDLSMPRMTGLQAALELPRRQPQLRVLILSMHDNEQSAPPCGVNRFLYPVAVRALARDYLDLATRGRMHRRPPDSS
jgi:CheY-like chemotaxis protein